MNFLQTLLGIGQNIGGAAQNVERAAERALAGSAARQAAGPVAAAWTPAQAQTLMQSPIRVPQGGPFNPGGSPLQASGYNHDIQPTTPLQFDGVPGPYSPQQAFNPLAGPNYNNVTANLLSAMANRSFGPAAARSVRQAPFNVPQGNYIEDPGVFPVQSSGYVQPTGPNPYANGLQPAGGYPTTYNPQQQYNL